MEFKCVYKKEKWKGTIDYLKTHIDYYEILIESRSSIYVLFGASERGGFACIPDYNAGCYLVNLKDKFWNTEQLVKVLGIIDGITVANALYALSKEISI